MKFQLETKWLEPAEQEIPAELQPYATRSRLLAQGLLRHGIRSMQQAQSFLDPRFYQPSDPFDLPDMDKAVERLNRAIRNKERIGVWGDFDVDGQTSTTLLVSALRQLGVEVFYHIPVRAKEGHGVHLPALDTFLQQGLQIVLTCDTGIDASDAVEFARQRGVDFIITDHHSLPETLPGACAVINPQRLPEDHPARTLSGVGVAWKLIAALTNELGQLEISEQSLDLVALGLVADISSLIGDARYLVQLGLQHLRTPRRPGLQKMFELAEVNPANLTEQHIGFTIAPRLNAIGRLGDANPVVEFLTTSDAQTIAVTAARLEGLNSERRFLTEQVFMGALSQIERNPTVLEAPVLLLSHPDWPAGVVGIVCNRLVELFQRPVILLSNPPGSPMRGSARSIEGVNITKAISAGREYLLGFGGHPMAAGLALDSQNLPAFQQKLNQAVRSQIGDKPLVREIQIDANLELDQIQPELIAEIDQLAPFGAGNPPLVYATGNLRIADSSPIGRTGEHLQVLVEDARGQTRRVIWWQGEQGLLPSGRFDLAYTLRASNYRGQAEIQMEWLDARQRVEEALELGRRDKYEQIVDLRSASDPLAVLPGYLHGDVVLWQEGSRLMEAASSRNRLRAAETLVIWNAPPGAAELAQAIKTVKPIKIVLFAVPYGTDQPGEFLTNLTGMVRYALRAKSGQIDLVELAAALNQRVAAVEAGLRWLTARGIIHFVTETIDQFVLAEGGVPDIEKVSIMENALRNILRETAAYRAFYLRADPRELLKLE